VRKQVRATAWLAPFAVCNVRAHEALVEHLHGDDLVHLTTPSSSVLNSM